MKVIKYKICTKVNFGTEKTPIIAEILSDVKTTLDAMQGVYDKYYDTYSKAAKYNVENIVENYLNTDDAIKCTDKTKWDFETLFAKIEENSNQYALDHPEVHSVFDLYYVDNYASSDDEKYYNLEIMQGIREGIISEIQTAIANNDQHQLHQFSTIKSI